ncbi:MAG: type II secretion system F family protein [Erysipelotrichaceae bacterium]|nr:type II secretion system F family protein [Erysipelotrichaceae bacterium]
MNSNMYIYLITGATAVFFYCILAIIFIDPVKEKVRKKLDDMSGGQDIDSLHSVVMSEKKLRKKRKTSGKSLISKKFEDNLAVSGVELSAKEFMLLWVGLTLGPIAFGAVLNLKIVAIIGLCIVGFVIPIFMVSQAKKKKQELFNKQLGEALTIMSNCLRTGYSFQQSLASIANEMSPPISTEFERVVKEVEYGTDMKEALNNLVLRTQNKDLELLVSAVLTSMQVGANLSEILDTIADTVRERIRLREEVQVLSAQGRFSGLIIGALPAVVLVFLMIINPGYFEGFYNNQIGKILIIGSVIMEAIGFFIISRIVDIKY